MEKNPPRLRLLLAATAACLPLAGCITFDHQRLDEDQTGYSRAIGEADKRQTLLNVIRLRYGDIPTFLQATQVISGYQLQQNVSAGFQALPANSINSFFDAASVAQLQQSPTFTFQPMAGQEFAQSFINPLSPAELLSLAISGLPIDVIFRLGVQSVNGLANASALTDVNAAGSPDFYLLLHQLRQLQIAGLLGVTLQRDPNQTKSKDQSDPGRVHFVLTPATDGRLTEAERDVRRLLGVAANVNEIEVVYGRFAGPGQVALFTRSMLGALQQLAIQAEVPPEDVASHRTQPTVGNIGIETRPVVVIHSGPKAPDNVFTATQYHDTWYWVASDDFDSKLAYTILQLLFAVAKTSSSPGAIITIPAG